MTSFLYSDEPIIIPVTPGEILVRLSRLIGRLNDSASDTAAAQIESLQSVRAEVLNALEGGDESAIASTLASAQKQLASFYESFQNDEARCETFGVPSPGSVAEATALASVDIETVTATFSLSGKQVLTSIAFERAAGATAYWLHIVRYWDENGVTQRVEDPVLESLAPLFPRVRLPVGKQILRLKSRNLSVSALSPEFTIEVPDLTQ